MGEGVIETAEVILRSVIDDGFFFEFCVVVVVVYFCFLCLAV